MSRTTDKAKNQIRTLIADAIARAQQASLLPGAEPAEVYGEVPAARSNGDYSTNAAMVNARAFRLAPRKIAEIIADNAVIDGTYFEKIEIAGPGFINFFLSDKYYADILFEIGEDGESYGRSNYGQGKSVNVEFVSANPTGPMHMGNARGGALGACLAAVLDYAGYDVKREFYVNDAGNQIDKFSLSLDVRYRQLCGENIELPEDSYHGEDIIERAQQFRDAHGDSYMSKSEDERRKALAEFALPLNLENMRKAMEKYRIDYDLWFSELTLHNGGELKETIDILTKGGYTYEKDGALWYKNKEVQTEMLLAAGKNQEYIDKLELKDDVLIRANGNPTYFAAEIAFHRNKLEKRGFDKAIDVWGADHHGHVARMKGAMKAVGIDPDRLDILLMQFVRLVRDGEVVRMSKRTGKAITLVDLLNEVPIDAVRFLFNMREPGSLMDFDLDLAVEQSTQNPVYNCQYAHARICSILRALAEEGTELKEDISLYNFTAPEEFALVTEIAKFPGEIEESVKTYEPSSITKNAIEVATMFHKFYNACRVRGESEEVVAARTALCAATKTVINNVLTMLKVSVPESM